MEEAQRNQIGSAAGIQALKDQRNAALDAWAQLRAELAATQAELEEARAELAKLKEPPHVGS